MIVTRLSEQDQELYSIFVAAHESGSFLQSWSWGDFQTAQGKPAVRYGIFVDDKKTGAQELIGTVQLLHTKIPRLPGTYVYAPYGPLISPDLTREETVEAAHHLIAKIKDEFPKAWFIRLEPKDNLPIDGKPSLHIQPGSTLVTDLTLNDEELLTQMHQKTRYNIKVAAKHGITINSELTASPQMGLAIKEALNLLTSTSDRQGYKSYSAAYYEQMLTFFKLHNADADCRVHLYQALNKGQCITTAIMLDHGTTRTYLFGGSDNSQRNLMAPYALHWQAMRDARAAGLTKYDWWGTETASGATPGFVQFKLRWGGTQKFYAGARDIVLNSKWYRAYNILRRLNRSF